MIEKDPTNAQVPELDGKNCDQASTDSVDEAKMLDANDLDGVSAGWKWGHQSQVSDPFPIQQKPTSIYDRVRQMEKYKRGEKMRRRTWEEKKQEMGIDS